MIFRKLWIINFHHTTYPKAHAHIHTHLTCKNVKKYNCVDKWLKPLYSLALYITIFSHIPVNKSDFFLFHPQHVSSLWIIIHRLCLVSL